MSRPVRRHAVQISLFPFLAVLICIMGALVVVLVMMVIRIDTDAKTAAANQAAVAADDSAIKQQLEDAQWRRQMLEQSRGEKSAELAAARAKLSHLEDHTLRLAAKARELMERAKGIDEGQRLKDDELAAAKTELARVQGEITRKEAELADARKKAQAAEKWYALIPYEGPHSTRRRPIYIECTERGVILQPEGFVLTPDDFSGPLGPQNPLDAALRTVREYITKTAGKSAGEPYPLLVVRPSGVIAYGAARAALKSWDEEFGYELVSEEKKLTFGSRDPALAGILEKAVAIARQRQAMMVSMMPRRYQSDDSLQSFAIEDSGGGTGGGAGGGGYAYGSGTGRGGSGGRGTGSGTGPGSGTGQGGGTGSGLAGGAGTGSGRGTGTGRASMTGSIPGTAPNGGGPYDTFPGGLAAGGPAGSGLASRGGAAGTGNSPGGAGAGGYGPAGSGSGTGGGYGPAGGAAGTGRYAVAGAGGVAGGGTGSGASGPGPAGGVPGGPYAAGNGSSGSGGNSGGGGTPGASGGTPSMLPGSSGFSGSSGNPSDPTNSFAGAQSGMPSANLDLTQPRTRLGQSGQPSQPGGDTPGGVGDSKHGTPAIARRGSNWAIPGAQRHATAITRPIHIAVLADRVVLVPQAGEQREPQHLPVSEEMTVQEVDAFVAAVQREMKSWGLAVQNGYWKPVIDAEIAPGAENHFASLQAALEGSGFQLQRTVR